MDHKNFPPPEHPPKFIFGDMVSLKDKYFKGHWLIVKDVIIEKEFKRGVPFRNTWYYKLQYSQTGEFYYDKESNLISCE